MLIYSWGLLGAPCLLVSARLLPMRQTMLAVML
jgi:hypothetical protein